MHVGLERVMKNVDNCWAAVHIVVCSLGVVVNAALYVSYRRRDIKTYLMMEFGLEPSDVEVHEG